ncbi:protein phosphatase 1 regulatory subunit 1B-like [Alosa sapidissima]|uniref:protein phosphatase 1 regulatory subunit 1B-like n=1 Tax=Alosa sapidissima TaxID=34773 RepID=UPI001C09267A|nr:protein phosphatase 1 regulatory subunit 1B-like [Alosa sapidissima]
MEPFLSADMEGEEAKDRRKIQFSVPSAVPTQLDPRQVEMIRRRRPTPATLFRLTDHPSPEEELCSLQMATGENGILKPKRQNIAVYQPPSLKAVQRMAQAHMHNLDGSPEGGDKEDGTLLGLESYEDSLGGCGSDQSAQLLGSGVTTEERNRLPDEEEDGVKDKEVMKGREAD